ncbi:MAG TPA: DNA recombination protein RmuC [Caulobacteraceae bacterium]|jgi:DNA recombination protein RmuC
MNTAVLLALACAAVAALALITVFGLFRALDGERRRAAGLEAELGVARERVRHLEDSQAATAEFMRVQAQQSAQAVAEQLVQRADEKFHAQNQLAQARLEAQLKPVSDTLAKFQEQVQAIETARAEQAGGLQEQLKQLMSASAATQAEAQKLSQALRRGAGVQGRWGEQVLRNVLEMAGLQRHFDFVEQASTDTDEGRRRPDVVVRLPGGGNLVIDAKVSLNAFLEAQECLEEGHRDACLVRYVNSLREHVRGLSGKAYQSQFERSPDLVAMFVPGDGFLAVALDRHPELLTEAMERKVVIVTPTTLFALCKAVAYGWRAEEQAANADKVAALGRELYKRLATMGEHAASVGRSLGAAVGAYNKFVGSLESQVMTQARRFEDLAVEHEGKKLPELGPIEEGVRPLAKLAAAESILANDPAAA